ncbi:phosphatase PAP2 family protein [Undibacterium sp. Di27W]|uniref:phosphatase PAP2 family protein n=1 Tax=Undibacterium sp. Di27W TaxID=3413036 RepID=UPI003BF396AA
MDAILKRLQLRWPKLLALFVGVLLPFCLFSMLAGEAIEREVFFFDQPILMFLHAHANGHLDTLMLFFTHIGSAPWVVTFELLLFGVLLYTRRRMDAVFTFLSLVGTALLNMLAKNFFARIRPDFWVSLQPETSYSFPSGHSMNAMALVAVLIILSWRSKIRWPVAITAVCFAFMVSASRLYLGVHFPSDVLAGWTAALTWVIGLAFILKCRTARGEVKTPEVID